MKLFFRNDDLGWEPEKLERLLKLCSAYQIKLNCAAIPEAASALYSPDFFAKSCNLLEIHSHGFTHKNHASAGKKTEYGANREASTVFSELKTSRTLLEELFPTNYFPAFVPPWNRFDDKFLPLLNDAGFRLLSRYGDAQSNAIIPEWNPEIDLHTSKREHYQSADEVFARAQSLMAERLIVGIMLHHGRMEDSEFAFLEDLFQKIQHEQVETYFLSELI